MKRIIKRLGLITGIGLAAVIALPILLAGFLTAKVWMGQPSLDGERIAPGLAATTTLSRDSLGVVHIKAENEQDAYFGLGYAHAQDRFFQMDAMRRIAWGRLAETAGSTALPIDIRMRRLGAGRLAEGDAAILTPAMRSIYQAYANGVNAWLTTRKGVAADELTILLTGKPEPWKIEHSLAWNRLMALRLVTNWGSELMRLRLAKNLSAKQLADLFPSYPADRPLTIPDVPTATLEAAQAFAELSNAEDGSNAWAVSPEASASGKGLLANDPHLGLATPGVWYLTRIEAPGLLLAGATAPGVPAMVLGHNGHVAWGLTNATTDTSDVYVETVDPDDPAQYLTPKGPKPFEERVERITVRFRDAVDLRVRTTRHGPVISDEEPAAATGTVLALAHTGFLPGEHSSETLYWINRARSWPDMLAALTFTTGPQQNVFYAGPDGVGMATGGALPIRRNADGYMPADGAKADGDWVGFADVSGMPQIFKPAKHWVANANNKLVGDGYPLALGREWGYHGRIAQIIKALDRADPIDLDAMQAIQYDITSPIAQNLLPVMLEQLQGAELNADAKALQSKLQNWDLKTGMNDSEPLIFFTWMRETIRLVFQDELGPSFDGWFSLRVTPLERVLKDRPVWCDNIRAAPIEDCPTILAQALARANTWLQDKYGDDPGDWHWGDAHSARFRHLAFGFIPVLNRLFDIRLPAPGSQESVNRAAFHISNEAEPFAQGHGPGLRALYDIADLEKSRFIIGPGQSGRLFSANRSSMTKPWRDGGLIRLAPIASPLHLLILQPKAVP